MCDAIEIPLSQLSEPELWQMLESHETTRQKIEELLRKRREGRPGAWLSVLSPFYGQYLCREVACKQGALTIEEMLELKQSRVNQNLPIGVPQCLL